MTIFKTNYLANFLTLLNFISWVLSIILIFKEHYILWITSFFFWQLFDMFDWKLARKYGSTKNWALYDDIADFVTFWLLPWLAILAVFEFNFYTILLSFVYIWSVFFRLWRFIKIDQFDKNLKQWNFKWLPSPAWAIIVLSFILTENNFFSSSVIVIITSLFMISKVEFAHFWKVLLKKLKNKKTIAVLNFALVSITFISIELRNLDIFLFFVFILWILYWVFGRIFRVK